MRRSTLLAFVGFAILILQSPRAATANVTVGDHPQVAFRSTGGEQISLEALHGKIVLIDFWATWCGPCMNEAPHMVAINEKYGAKGLQILGISRDQDAQALSTVAREKGFAWPQCLQGSDQIAQQFGIDSIPRCFLIGPDGDVLWTGHPANLDAPLADAFAKHPPRLVDEKTLAEAVAACDQLEAALKSGDAAAAMKQRAVIAQAALADEKFAARVAVADKSLAEIAASWLKDATDLAERKKYAEATARLESISTAMGTSESGVAARKQLADLAKLPEAKSQIESARRIAHAAAALDAARKLQDAKKPEAAYIAFKAIAHDFPETPAAAEAKTAITEFERDPAFVKKASDDAAGGKAKGALSLARMYASAGKTDVARKKYEEIIAAWPTTTYAETARQELASLPKN